MEGDSAQGTVEPSARAGGLTVRVASPRHDAGIRGLLSRAVLPGAVRLTLTRDPDYAASLACNGHRHTCVVVEDSPDGAVIGLGVRSMRCTMVGGRVESMGYLNQLRSAPGRGGSVKAMRQAFGMLGESRGKGEYPWDITTLVEGNARAERLLTAGLRDIPKYWPVGRLVTLAIPPPAVWSARQPGKPEVVTPGTAASAWAARAHGLDLADSCPGLGDGWGKLPGTVAGYALRNANGGVRAGGVLWDQAAVRQVRVAAYSPWIRVLRPLANAFAMAGGGAVLPPAGGQLRCLHLAWAESSGGDGKALIELVAGVRAQIPRHCLLLVSRWESDAALPELRRAFRPREYASLLYAVDWDRLGPPPWPSQPAVALEVATL